MFTPFIKTISKIKTKKIIISISLLGLIILSKGVLARTSLVTCAASITPDIQQQLLQEHVRFGLPSTDNIEVKHSYVSSFDDVHNVPKWTAWHATKSYLDTPIGLHNKKRYGTWAAFRTDPVYPNITPKDYTGWYKKADLIKGHLTPYFISGGDRDHDGLDAEIEGSSTEEDVFDACATYEVNEMSNITPQYHHSFNGQGGAWFALETDVRKLLRKDKDLNIIAGSIFLNEDIKYIGNLKQSLSKWDIAVPHGFYKIILDNNKHEAFAFLFSHDQHVPNGCDTRTANGQVIKHYPSECITSIENVETLAGINIYPNLSSSEKQSLFANSNSVGWNAYRKTN